MQRHIPAAKIDHFCAHGAMCSIKWSSLKSHYTLSENKKGAARNRAAPHLSSLPERLQPELRAPSVVTL
jgi:hypothetical protein